MGNVRLCKPGIAKPEDRHGQIAKIPAGSEAGCGHRYFGTEVVQQQFQTSLGLKIAPGRMEMQNAEHDRR
jgi:hypothetical protein